jgi:putative peptidoglycan lipid II flippase
MGEGDWNNNQRVTKAAGIVMAAFLLSQLIGLVAKILIAGSFSAGLELDAFYAANRPSETLVTIMAGGILVSSFIPVFVGFLVKKDHSAAWTLASATANIILVVMTVMACLVVVLAGPIVRIILGAGFVPEKQILTINLLRIQAISILFFGLSGLIIGILNSYQKFLASALAPAMYQLGQIFGVLVLAPRMGIYGLAWGVVIGSILNLLIQVPTLIRLKGKYRSNAWFKTPAVGEVFRLMGPRMFGAAVVQLMLWVNTLLASHMADGSVFALTSGFSLMIMAQAAIAQSMATAVMPTFSTQVALEKLDELGKTLVSALRSVVLLTMPATCGLIILAIPLVTFLYQRGAFTVETTRMVAWALTWYSAGLVFHSILEVLVRAFYAMHNTKTPVLVGAAAMTISIGLSLVFSSLFRGAGWMPLGGLALAVSVSTALEVTVLFLLLRRRLVHLQIGSILQSFLAAALGSIFLVAALWFWVRWNAGSRASIITMGGVVIGGIIYGVVLLLIKNKEAMAVMNYFRKRIHL